MENFYGLLIILILFFVLGSGLYISLSLILLGALSLIFAGHSEWGSVLATSLNSSVSGWSMAALPLFLWMGEILLRSNLSKNLFDGLSVWMDKVPGKLYHVNILSCGIFAAVCGSSAATVATIGNLTLKELDRLGYQKSMSIATLGGAGTLGLLIPPSIMMIVYGLAADVSIARLFLAGIFPGFLLLGLFMIYTIIYTKIYSNSVPQSFYVKLSFIEKIKKTKKLLPILTLIFLLLSSIYMGIATPSEAAALGVLASLFLVFLEGSLTYKVFKEGLLATVISTGMLLFIIASANTLAVGSGFLGIPQDLAKLIGSFELSQFELIIALTFLFVILGCFLDGISMVLLTTSIILPIIEQAGFNLIWFGIYLILVVEMSQITPPVGFNLFVLQSLTQRDILNIAKITLPFFLLILLGVVILYLFPEIATYLPEKLS